VQNVEKTSWLVKGYPYSVNLRDPTQADNGFLASHIWINAESVTAYILDSVVGGVATWSVRPPDYIKNLGTEYQINVIERVPTGTGTTGAPPTITGLPDQAGQAGEYLKTDGQSASWEPLPGGVALPEIADPDDGELHLTPKASSNGAEGTIFYSSDDNSVYVGVE